MAGDTPSRRGGREAGQGLLALAGAAWVAAAVISCGHLTLGGAGKTKTNPFGGCGMCHVDVLDELAGGEHLAADIGCVRCHGPSKAHLADENNEVKPDRMPSRDQIDSFCGSCHKCTRPVRPVRPAATQPKPKICTDCHGTHKLKLR